MELCMVRLKSEAQMLRRAIVQADMAGT
jgi:hypothetical protein